jgi:hypothetical protein
MKGAATSRMVLSSILGSVLLIYSTACGGSSTRAVTALPTPDSVTRNYVALVHNYWIQYKTAEADPIGNVAGQLSTADAARACFGLLDPSTQDVRYVDPPTCRVRSVAMVAVHEKFLSDLDTTRPPPEFATDDKTFRSQLPKAIADLNAMISATNTGSKDAVLQATTAYVNDMMPTVTDALDNVDPSVVHN